MLNLVLANHCRSRIRDLSGFRRTHQIPADDSDRARTFVGRIAADEINGDLDERFADFRRELKLRRTQMLVSDADGGVGFIRTPDFTYQISVGVGADDSSQAVWRRQVAEFPDPAPLLGEDFSRAFGTMFDTVEFVLPEPIEIEAFIDHLEENPADDLRLDYDRSVTWCRVSAAQLNAEMTIRQDCVAMQSLQPRPPSALLQAFFAVRDSLPGIPWLDGQSSH